jgi:hypothetical protein
VRHFHKVVADWVDEYRNHGNGHRNGNGQRATR